MNKYMKEVIEETFDKNKNYIEIDKKMNRKTIHIFPLLIPVMVVVFVMMIQTKPSISLFYDNTPITNKAIELPMVARSDIFETGTPIDIKLGKECDKVIITATNAMIENSHSNEYVVVEDETIYFSIDEALNTKNIASLKLDIYEDKHIETMYIYMYLQDSKLYLKQGD